MKAWGEKSLSMSALRIAGFAAAGVIFILAALQFAGVLKHADNIYIPGLSVLMFIQAAENRKNNKGVACISFLAGLFVLAVVAVHFLTAA